MESEEPSLRECLESGGGFPRHLVDRPRAKRCDQHRAQRKKWNDANLWRTKHGLMALPWEPHPLTPQRLLAAQLRFADRNARDIHVAVAKVRGNLRVLEKLRPTITGEHNRKELGARIASIERACRDLEITAVAMT